MTAYKEIHYEQAIQHFEGATELDAGNINAHLYLATASVSLYIPGVDNDDNKAFAEERSLTISACLICTQTTRRSLNSAKGIAYLYLNLKNWGRCPKVLPNVVGAGPE